MITIQEVASLINILDTNLLLLNSGVTCKALANAIGDCSSISVADQHRLINTVNNINDILADARKLARSLKYDIAIGADPTK